ncbi:4a-hydroxytetrahydrobiopterin dehydratase [Demetria terragena]|uniref:4a-hydroxytetrahydrobiopterin dehydratase n=1 Tax=Demetria terragena TaxID=63959 RepID=UPI0003706A0D|nr:4a-hydroxytetrahydrobiopterin dehydratase [Demetria terragena]
MSALTRQQISDRAPDGWRLLLKQIQTTAKFETFTAAGEFVARIGALADERDHHPDLAIRWPGHVEIVLTSHDVGAVTDRDLTMAEVVTDLAAERGAVLDPSGCSIVEVALDVMDIDQVRPFWAALLGYVKEQPGVADDTVRAIRDPHGLNANMWFQQMDEPRTERNRFHLDVVVPHDEAQQRLDAALAAGGRLLSDERARAFWVLADPEGNEACICTWQDRD